MALVLAACAALAFSVPARPAARTLMAGAHAPRQLFVGIDKRLAAPRRAAPRMDGDTPDDLVECAARAPRRARAFHERPRGARIAAGVANALAARTLPRRRYSLRMLGFAASAVAGLVFTIFIGPAQAFMRNPRTASIAGVGLGAAGVLLLLTLHAMTSNDVPLPREAAEQSSFTSYQPPTFE